MEDVDPEELVSTLVVVSSRLTRALRRVIGKESDMVTLRALAVVEQYQPIRVGHFAQGYLCSQPAATKLLARLEDDGFVVRESCANDRRASQFSLTEAGRARLAVNRTIMTEQMVPYFEGLTAEERLSVDRALALVGDYLRNEHPVDTDDRDPAPASASDAGLAPASASEAGSAPVLASEAGSAPASVSDAGPAQASASDAGSAAASALGDRSPAEATPG